MHFASPFQYERSTGNHISSLARLFDSLVRVSRRVGAPHFHRQHGASQRRSHARGLRRAWPFVDSAHFTMTHKKYSFLHFVARQIFDPWRDNAVGLVLAVEMEVLPLSLSRLQVLFHSLSKVLFKLSLTLLVRYRSSYSVFNFGRQIPASLTLHSQTVLLS